jgi:hypothetical protein
MKSIDYALMVVLDLDTGDRHLLPEQGTVPTVTTTGHLVYVRYGIIRAIEFDLETYSTRGQSFDLESELFFLWPGSRGTYALSATGTLAYVPGLRWAEPQLVWVDLQSPLNEVTPAVKEQLWSGAIDLSPNRHSLLIEDGYLNKDILIYDLARGQIRASLRRDWDQELMTWLSNDEQVLLRERTSNGRESYLLWSVTQAEPEPFFVDLGEYSTFRATSASPDGEWVIGEALHPETDYDLVRVSLEGGGVVHELLGTNARERRPEYSPDGNLIAYVSTFGGEAGIWVVRASEVGSRGIRVAPGWAFRWGAGSDVLYCYTEEEFLAGELAAVPVLQDPDLAVGQAARVFKFGGQFTYGRAYYFDIGADDRLLAWMDDVPLPVRSTEIRVELNWFEKLRRAEAEQLGSRGQ